MRDLLLHASGFLAMLVGTVHGVLGETKVFARTTIEPPRMRRLLRAIWQCSAAAWIGGGLLIFVSPWLNPHDARRWIVFTFAAIYAVGIAGNAWVFRGRHYGWVLLGAVVALSLAGL